MDGVLTFAAPPADPDSVYRAVDLLMLVSDWGGSGLHLLEGLARGVPTIATGGGEILEHRSGKNSRNSVFVMKYIICSLFFCLGF